MLQIIKIIYYEFIKKKFKKFQIIKINKYCQKIVNFIKIALINRL
jgi:hypothetical protein